jgi:hypothetical protein
VVILIIDGRRALNDIAKFDFIPLIFAAVFLCLNLFVFPLKKKKFWKNVKVEAEVIDDGYDAPMLRLHYDNTFEVQTGMIDWSCFYVGDYSFENDTLKLIRKDLEEVTHDEFTNVYVRVSDTLIPIDSSFKNIEILY